MFVSVIHRITDPDRFFAFVAENVKKIPPDLKLPMSFTNADRSTTVCLWEAASVARVQEFLEPALAGISQNQYAQVDTSLSLGLPAATVA